MATSVRSLRALALATCCFAAVSVQATAQTAYEGQNLSALAQANLKKPRPKAPADLTGEYNFDMFVNGGPFTAYKFDPHPPLTPAAQAMLDKEEAYFKKGDSYHDDPGACWPLGVPRIMTRYWPLQIIQLPTEVLIINMFENNVRWIFMDGRKHPSDDNLVYSYNGHSIGHWEGKTLVVDTVGLTGDHHWIEEGIPASDDLHVVERLSLTPKGFQDEYSMTDPQNWVGVWKSTKQYTRDDHADLEEHKCIYEEVSKLPSFKHNIRE